MKFFCFILFIFVITIFHLILLNMNIRPYLVPLIACTLTACSSVSYLEIPVYHTAATPFPAIGESLLLVNNAVEQPTEADSHVQYLNGNTQRIAFDRDSITSSMVSVLGEFLYASNLFSDVLIYDLPLRSDTLWNNATFLTVDELDTLRAQSGADWILSLDAITYQTILKESTLPEFKLSTADLQMIIKPVFRLYPGGKYSPVKHYYLSDTLSWKGYGADFKHAFNTLPQLSQCMNDLVYESADKIYKTWMPYQEKISRFYVRSPHSAMREAEDFFIHGKGEEAAIMWEYVFTNVKDQRTRFYAAYNLAVYFESIGDYDNALKWIDECIELDGNFKKVEGLDPKQYKASLKANQIETQRAFQQGMF